MKAGIPHLRCAIYTRVSTDHGLEQEFNSLDSQREASEAFRKDGPELEQAGPLSRVLCAHNLAIRSIDEGKGAITEQTLFGQITPVDLFGRHGLYGMTAD